MKIEILMLSRHFYTNLDFNDLKERLKRKIGLNYKLGVIDNEEISIYYLRNRYTENGMDHIPTCKVEIKNENREDGRLIIKFSIATYYLITIGLIPIAFMMVFYFTKAPIPFYYLLGLYPVLYLLLFFILSDQADKFYLDLKKIETETKLV